MGSFQDGCVQKKNATDFPFWCCSTANVLSVFNTMALILGVSLQYSQHTVAASTDTGKQNRVPLQCHTVETSQRCLRSKENKRLVSSKKGSGSCNLVPPRQHQHKISCKSLQREKFVTGPPHRRSHNHTVSCLKFYCKIGKKGEKERKSPSKHFLFDTYLYLTVTLKKSG